MDGLVYSEFQNKFSCRKKKIKFVGSLFLCLYLVIVNTSAQFLSHFKKWFNNFQPKQTKNGHAIKQNYDYLNFVFLKWLY